MLNYGQLARLSRENYPVLAEVRLESLASVKEHPYQNFPSALQSTCILLGKDKNHNITLYEG